MDTTSIFLNHQIDKDNSKVIVQKGPKDYVKKVEHLEMLKIYRNRNKSSIVLNKKIQLDSTYQSRFTLLR